MFARLRHIHARRTQLLQDLDPMKRFEAWEESCVPSYCHRNLAAAYLSWWRLYAAVDLAHRHARWETVLDFGAAIGELRRLLPPDLGRYDFIEQNDLAAGYLSEHTPDARRQTLSSAPDGGYSCVFALDALEHNPDFAELLARLATKLAAGGVLILSGPTESRLYRIGRRVAGFHGHYHETNIHQIEAAAERLLQPIGWRSLPVGAPLFRLSAWRAQNSAAR